MHCLIFVVLSKDRRRCPDARSNQYAACAREQEREKSERGTGASSLTKFTHHEAGMIHGRKEAIT